MEPIDLNYAWSTHQPLIKLMLKVYDPQFILELGIGHFSTPLFLKHGGEKMFIENDKEWIDLMGIDAIHHKINVPNQDIPVNSISLGEKKAIFDYYYDLKQAIYLKPSPKLLFVDNYSCCRALAINTLYSVFDIIIYHDSEPQSVNRNNYYFESNLISNFKRYDLQTPATWATCFINNKLQDREDLMYQHIKGIIQEYEQENKVTGIIFTKL